jgi:4-amino-4-deoxy-L-arabinose transferase-like glycosyltransferase
MSLSRTADAATPIEADSKQRKQIPGARSLGYPLVLTVIATLLFLPGLGARDFWAPGEPIYGEVIRVMFEKNNWLVPMLNAHIYADKPVLYFWLALVVSKLGGGVSEWTVRLPTALGAFGLVLTTYQLGRTFYDRETGFLAGLILATTNRVLWESRFLRLDTVLSFFLLLGFFWFLKAFLGKGPKYFFIGAYICFAFATLTKGPIGLLLPGLAILILIGSSGRWSELKHMRLVSGAILVIALIVPWLLALHLRGEDQWIHDFIWIHNVRNYALEPIGHIRPFYYYLLNLPLDFLPWTMALPGALIFYYPWIERLKNLPTLALSCWFVTTFVFFTLSKSKIAYYLLPLLPSVALLTGNYLRALMSGDRLQGNHWRCTSILFYFLAAILFVGGLAIPIVTYKVDRGLFVWALAVSMSLTAGSFIMLLVLKKEALQLFLWSCVGVLVATSLVSSIAVLPYLDKYKSPRPLGEFIRNHVPESLPVYIFQSTMSDFNYYARRDIIPVVLFEDGIGKMTKSSSPVYLIINDKDLNEIKRFRENRDIVTEQRIGERTWYLLRVPPVAS